MKDDRVRSATAPEGEGRDYRAVPVETVRRFAQDQAELTSIRQVAAEIGLGRTTLHKFVAGETMPHPRVRRLLALWYLRSSQPTGGEEAVRPYASALEVLLADVPDSARDQAAGEVLDVIARGYAASTGDRPEWLDALRARLADPG